MDMLFADFLRWWYGPGWALRLKMLINHVVNLEEYFSFSTIVKTLFSPWRQNITLTASDQALGDKMRALVDNVVSRMVGFFVRIFALIAAVIIIVVVFVLNLIYVIVWPLLPVSPSIIIAIGAMS
jgi:hypothetical protein